MEKRYSLTLDKEFIDYCKLNNIEDVEKLAKEIFDKGFSMKKYGLNPVINFTKAVSPKDILPDEKVIEKVKTKDLYDE